MAFGLTFDAQVKKAKGAVGESIVKTGATLALPASVYRRYHNVTLRTTGGTTQIDHVFVSVFGVFVAETKNMGGWIVGSERDREWTPAFPGGGSTSFRILSGRTIGASGRLRRRWTEGVVKSIVIFAGNAELKREMPENVTAGCSHIRSFRTRALSEGRVAEICTALEAARLKPSWKTDRQQVRDLRQRKDGPAPRRCPRCGRTMALRKAKRGPGAGESFWGCEGFPAGRRVEKA